MNKTIFYLETCNTCKRIMQEISVDDTWTLREIKSEPITVEELENIHKLYGGTYEDIFSKRAQKYRSLGLKEKNLSDEDYKNYMLEEYTFLKRPYILLDNNVFVGNSKKVIEQVKDVLSDK